MSLPRLDPTIGADLRRLRTEAGLDLAVLARRVSLSPAQLAELEGGQGGLFYSDAIRQQALRKVLRHLGGDLACLASPAAPVDTTAPVALPPPPAQPAPRPVSRLRVAGLALSVLCFAAAFLLGRQGAAPAPADAPAHMKAVAPATEAPGAPTSPATPQAPQTGQNEVNAPGPLAAATQDAAPQAPDCPNDLDGAPALTPPQASKPGDMVFVVSPVRAWLCLVDGSGRLHQRLFEAGQSQNFVGSPPWRLHSDQLRQVQLYFQGWKVRLPGQVRDSVELVELR